MVGTHFTLAQLAVSAQQQRLKQARGTLARAQIWQSERQPPATAQTHLLDKLVLLDGKAPRNILIALAELVAAATGSQPPASLALVPQGLLGAFDWAEWSTQSFHQLAMEGNHHHLSKAHLIHKSIEALDAASTLAACAGARPSACPGSSGAGTMLRQAQADSGHHGQAQLFLLHQGKPS